MNGGNASMYQWKLLYQVNMHTQTKYYIKIEYNVYFFIIIPYEL